MGPQITLRDLARFQGLHKTSHPLPLGPDGDPSKLPGMLPPPGWTPPLELGEQPYTPDDDDPTWRSM